MTIGRLGRALAALFALLPLAPRATCGERAVCTAHLDRETVVVGEAALIHVEVSGECAVDSELGDLPVIDGLEFEAAGGPEIAVRTRGGPDHGTEYLAEYRVKVTALRAGQFDVRGVGVRCSTGEELAANPVALRAVGADVEPVLQLAVTPNRARVYRRQPFSVRVRLEVDARLLSDLMSGHFTLPWQKDVVPLPGAPEIGESGPTSDVRSFETDAGQRPLRLRAARPAGATGILVLEGERWFVAPEAGVIDLSGSKFTMLGDRAPRTTRIQSGPERVASPPPARIDVDPLPAPPTAGAPTVVGPVTVEVAVAKNDVTVGEPLAVTLTVRAATPVASNLALAELPLGQQIAGFRVFDRREKPAAAGTAARVVQLSISPIDAAVASVPAIGLDWFDPEAAAWRRAESAAVALTVRAHPGGVELVDPARPPVDDEEGGVNEVYVILGLIVLVLAVAATIGFAVRAAERSNPEHVRSASTALSDLERELAASPTDDVLSVARALARFIATTTGADRGACFGADAASKLASIGIDAATCDATRAWFERAEEAAFAKDRAPGADFRAGAIELARRVFAARR